MQAHRLTGGTVHLLRLSHGADLYDEMSRFVIDNDIRAATVTFLGAVQRASLRYYDQEAGEYRDFVIDEPLEVVSGVGNVSLLNGRPFLHIHAALADARGHAHGGHVNTGTAVFALEATIQELEGEPPIRLPDDCTGLTLWGRNPQ